MRDAGAYAADGGYLWRSMWILWMTSLSSHSTRASVSGLSYSNTQLYPRQNAIVKRDPSLSNLSVAFQTLFK